jgi:S-adenosylmethionine hydrolase
VNLPNPPSGVITVTTDFGHGGPFAGVMKGVILGRFAEARIVDLTHEIPVHWPAEAGFWLARAFGYFPRGTVHMAVVDPGAEREIIVVSAAGHVFLAPDNGLLAPIVATHRAASLVRLTGGRLARIGIERVSATFHGRDVFAPVAAELASGRCAPADLGEPIEGLVPGWVEEPVSDGHGVAGTVVSIDPSGNLITNLDAALLKRFAAPQVHASSHAFRLGRTYGEVPPGGYLALVNSFGVIEIARAGQSAAEGLGLGRGAPVAIREGAPHQPASRG